MTTLEQPRAAGSGTRTAGVVIAAIAVTVLAWASAFVTVRSVRTDFDPGALALGRLLVGSVALAVALRIKGGWVRPHRREWLLMALCGVCWFGVYNVSLSAAERQLDAGTTAMLVNVGPILIALLAGAVLGEGFPRWLLIGAGIAFAGAILIGVASRSGPGGATLGGVALCLLAAACWAIGVTAQKKVLGRLPPLQVTQIACTIGAVATLPFSGQLIGNLSRATTSGVLSVVYLGLVPTALAFGTWAFALSRMNAGRLGITTYLVPPLTIALSWPLLGEVPAVLALGGGLIALVGIAVSRRR
ncbi:Threonine/homoserine efflux transporter RhtA [Nakamurella panacisegetis]|uniref:Threonine/homoserine efflux transporter RhtA n=1 Tax=Nakamurella panacisegetis TaxID=1090615 RepID=A0A1H0KEQ1_9ACTN|nr:DMT family transporter [Nakamurella panacisegetis]SDO54273.1 Threonine/homoserine efflux transporter RhtA [Nakamurella panacisegetis]